MEQVRILRDDNKEFTIDQTIWGLLSDGLKGFDMVDSKTYTESYYGGDGSRETGQQILEKDRTIHFKSMNPAINGTLRDFLLGFFNPTHHFKVYVTYKGRTRWCEGTQIKFSCPAGNIYKPLDVKWTIKCPIPYLFSVDNYGKDIASKIPLSLFPYQSVVGVGFGTGAYKFANQIEIENSGSVKTYMRCVMVASGPVTDPVIKKDNVYVKILDKMQKGDVYEIDFTKRVPTVRKNGVNAISRVDRKSAFSKMTLDPGVSTVGYTSGFGEDNLSVVVYYNKRYLGV